MTESRSHVESAKGLLARCRVQGDEYARRPLAEIEHRMGCENSAHTTGSFRFAGETEWRRLTRMTPKNSEVDRRDALLSRPKTAAKSTRPSQS
jgi:hypothetical protein